MRLFEAIVEANHRATLGDAKAGIHPEEYAQSLPVVALTCIDPRLNPLLPEVLGIPEEQFIWLRNAGNIITSPMSSTMRSLALACIVKGGKEIALIGHTDCRVGKSTMVKITDAMKSMGIHRGNLPENLVEFFGFFASERQNILKGVDFIRKSPVIGPKIPVHGLLVDIQTGKLEWLINGYDALERATAESPLVARKIEATPGLMDHSPDFKMENITSSNSTIGQFATRISELSDKMEASFHKTEVSVEKSASDLQSKIVADSDSIGRTPAHHSTLGDRIGDRIGERIGDKIGEFIDQKIEVIEHKLAPYELLARKIDLAKRYFLIGGDQKKYGPVTGKVILQWLEDNRIDAGTPVQPEGSDTWQTLSALPDTRKSGRPPLPPPIPSGKQDKKSKWF